MGCEGIGAEGLTMNMGGPFPKVYLVRHGETAWTISGQATGRTDIPLTERGERDAQGLAARLRDVRLTTVLTSPLQRAQRTADLAGFGKRRGARADRVIGRVRVSGECTPVRSPRYPARPRRPLGWHGGRNGRHLSLVTASPCWAMTITWMSPSSTCGTTSLLTGMRQPIRPISGASERKQPRQDLPG